MFCEAFHRLLSRFARRHHDPDRPRRLEFRVKIFERVAARGAFAGQLLNALGAHIPHHTFMTAAHQSSHHVGAHAAETNHSKLHAFILVQVRGFAARCEERLCLSATYSICSSRFFEAEPRRNERFRLRLPVRQSLTAHQTAKPYECSASLITAPSCA